MALEKIHFNIVSHLLQAPPCGLFPSGFLKIRFIYIYIYIKYIYIHTHFYPTGVLLAASKHLCLFSRPNVM